MVSSAASSSMYRSNGESDIINYKECDASKMPFVLLEKYVSITNIVGGDKLKASASSFRVLQRWEPQYLFENADRLDVLLSEAANNSSVSYRRQLLTGEENTYPHHSRRLSSLKKGDNIKKIMQNSDVFLRRLSHQKNNIKNNNTTITQGYYLARECSCFGDNENEHNTTSMSFCPIITSICRRNERMMIDNNYNSSSFSSHNGRIIETRTTCYPEVPRGGRTPIRLLIFAANSSIFLYILYCCCTHNGRSCMSYLPAKILNPMWNKTVAYLLLRFRPNFAKQMIRNYVMEQHNEIMRQRQLLTEASQTPAAEILPQPFLVLQTKIFQNEKYNIKKEGGKKEQIIAKNDDSKIDLNHDSTSENEFHGSIDEEESHYPENSILGKEGSPDKIYNEGTISEDAELSNDEGKSSPMGEVMKNQEKPFSAIVEGDDIGEMKASPDDRIIKTEFKDEDKDKDRNQATIKTVDSIISIDNSNGDITDEITCSICLLDVQDGDRVGVLSCNHVFHVDCLKQWLPKRNVCPLCQSNDAARIRYE